MSVSGVSPFGLVFGVGLVFGFVTVPLPPPSPEVPIGEGPLGPPKSRSIPKQYCVIVVVM